jgi:branched-chain amino acid transport system ATP-binding protein
MVEHVMQAVMNLADHVYVLNNGQLIAAGAPNEIANNRDVIEAYLGHGTAARLRARAGRPYA